jgi:hypothetical protein
MIINLILAGITIIDLPSSSPTKSFKDYLLKQNGGGGLARVNRHEVEKTTPSSGVAGNVTYLLDLDENCIAIAVVKKLFNFLNVSRSSPFVPKFRTRAALVVSFARF